MVALSIIIVTYNSSKFIASCLNSINDETLKQGFEVIVVDNASTDDTVSIVKQYPEVILIENKANLGYSKANNIGINKSRSEYLMFLNPDVIINPSGIEKLITDLKQKDYYGMVAPKLLYPNGKLQESVRRYPKFSTQIIAQIPIIKGLLKKHLDSYYMKDWDHGESREVDWIIGAVMLTKKETLDKVGYFDEDFFLYCEDIDLCYRLNQAGYKIFYDANVHFVHNYQKSSRRGLNKLTWIHLISIIKFYIKHPKLLF